MRAGRGTARRAARGLACGLRLPLPSIEEAPSLFALIGGRPHSAGAPAMASAVGDGGRRNASGSPCTGRLLTTCRLGIRPRYVGMTNCRIAS